jgi:hypothetical protein
LFSFSGSGNWSGGNWSSGNWSGGNWCSFSLSSYFLTTLLSNGGFDGNWGDWGIGFLYGLFGVLARHFVYILY